MEPFPGPSGRVRLTLELINWVITRYTEDFALASIGPQRWNAGRFFPWFFQTNGFEEIIVIVTFLVFQDTVGCFPGLPAWDRGVGNGCSHLPEANQYKQNTADMGSLNYSNHPTPTVPVLQGTAELPRVLMWHANVMLELVAGAPRTMG